MSATVTIDLDEAPGAVLTVPVRALFGGADLGKELHCFVLTPAGPEERTVVLGHFNETTAEVVWGLAEGEEVVLDPQAVLKTRDPGRPAVVGD
jgi:hypothetical protein